MLKQIEKARERLSEYFSPTPTVRSDILSQQHGGPVRLKLETQQPTGSFKVRPSMNSMLTRLEQARSKGVVTSSSGNFA
ncbi:MAG: pyridoxal-phosphate dependent enzyme, partial [Acidobacteriia bacterium]|nr:pyridoxal-phosphate dependent enzyme [Terriglobia bacterium]